MHKRMKRVLAGVAVAGALVLALPSASSAQAAPSPDRYLGHWQGPFVSDGPSGTMHMIAKKDGEDWKVEVWIEAEGAPPAGELRDWKIEGAEFSFAQIYGEFDVFFRGMMEGEQLKGSLEAYQAGSLVGTGSFQLNKQP